MIKEKKIVLFNEKKDCCGCGACYNICVSKAITMTPDEHGFIYPEIDYEKCIYCGRCKEICGYQNRRENAEVKSVYVAIAQDDELLKCSASGGIFATAATEVLHRNGVVFGCSLEKGNHTLSPVHIKIERLDDLIKLQGSKYVQSYIGNTYQEVKRELSTKRLVLYSGTPCQIAGLNSYLGATEYNNLLTIDVICHGVPSAEFFQGYIKTFEKQLRGTITDFKFRDKTDGWGCQGRVEYLDKRGVKKSKIIQAHLSSYYSLFLNSDIYRENCYQCQYANSHRPSDLTIGDYWGIEEAHPEYLVSNGGNMDEKKGISCILVNTEKGKVMLTELCVGLEMKASTFAKVSAHNRQLNAPSHSSEERKVILAIYAKDGYEAVDRWYYKRFGIKKYFYYIWNNIPLNVQKLTKKIFGKE